MQDTDKKCLIITSSGGNGHIAMKEAKEQELIAKGLKKEEIYTVDITGVNKDKVNNEEPWVPTIKNPITGHTYFSGPVNVETWNTIQQKGGKEAVVELENLLGLQLIAENIQYQSVYQKTKKFLLDNPNVTEVYDTQAMSTIAICRAIAEVNEDRPKDKQIGYTKIVTEFLTHKATHFLNPISQVPKEYRDMITVEVVEPPLLGPEETLEDFYKEHGVEGIKFRYLSEIEGAEPNVRKEFKTENFNAKAQIVIKAALNDDSSKDMPEESFLSSKLTGVESSDMKGGKEFVIAKKPEDKLITITMGSQVSKTVLDYVDKFIDDAVSLEKEPEGNIYLCLVGLKNESREGGTKFYAAVRDHIDNRLKELESQGKTLSPKIKILPLGFQDGKHMASLLQTSDVLVTRSGGISSIEAKYTQEKNPTRQVYVHSEEEISSSELFPNNPDSRYETLLSGALHWEAGNGEFLMKNIGASFVSPDTINFNLAGEKTLERPLSLFEMAYNTYSDKTDRPKLNEDSIEKIKRLILEGSNPNLTFPDGSKLIDHCKDTETREMLVQYGAKLTPTALAKTHVDDIPDLKKEREKFKSDFSKGKSIIHQEFANAIENSDIDVMKGIIYQYPEISHSKILGKVLGKDDKMVDGMVRPLHYAIEHNQLKSLELLIKTGADINQVSVSNGTALHYAIANNNVEAVRVLLNNGADPTIKFHGQNLRDYLEKCAKDNKGENYSKMLELLVEQKVFNPGVDILPVVPGAAIEDLKEIMFKENNKYGNNEIHRAVFYANTFAGDSKEFTDKFNSRTLKEVLIDNIEDLNKPNGNLKMPLSLCTNQAVRRQLVQLGADVKYLSKIDDRNDLNELSTISKAYNKLFTNTVQTIATQFEKSESAEKFAENMLNVIQTEFYKGLEKEFLNPEQQEEVKKYFEGMHSKLKEATTTVEQFNIIQVIIDAIKKIFGVDALTKAVNDIVEKETAKDIKGKFTKMVVEKVPPEIGGVKA